MPESTDPQAELLRQFQAAVSGMELSDLRQLAGDLLQLGGEPASPRPRPELRRPPLDQVAIYRVRVDLDHAAPPIWRRLDLRSDLPLDVVHQVLQAAFDWTDSHLHRFSIGGHPFAPDSQLFLCPFDVEEAEDLDEGGILAADVRLDETLREPGDVLRYAYDYGDSWELTLRLEEVLPAEPDAPSARAVDGRRAAPPEDCGGITEAEDLAEVLDDPARFDPDEVNQALRAPYFVLREGGVDDRLVDLVHRLELTSIGADLASRVMALTSEPSQLPPDELVAALRAHQWFLDRADADGIELTPAGYLKPNDVEAAVRVVPAMGDWIGKNNRENQAAPLLGFRLSLQSMGLLRKYKGKLLLTRAGRAARRDPVLLWEQLAARLVPDKPDTFESAATLILLAYAGTSPGESLPTKPTTAALTELGWRHQDGEPLSGYELYRLAVIDTLANVTDRRVDLGGRHRVSPAAAALARAALRR